MEVYNNSPLFHQFQNLKKAGKGRAGKRAGGPKRASSAFLFFSEKVPWAANTYTHTHTQDTSGRL
jgi:hypothetical protein